MMKVLMSRKWFWSSLIIILILGIVIRFWKLGSIPVGLYWDETAMLIDARSIAQTGLDMHGRPWYQLMFPSYGDYKLPVYIWLAAISVKFLGASELALRLPSALAGTGTILIAGAISKLILKISWQKKAGDEIKLTAQQKLSADLSQLATMLIVAISPWSIIFSRTAFEGHLAQFFLGSSILTWLLAQKKSKTISQILLILLSATLGALSTYTYFSVRFVWPFIILALQLLLINRFLSFKPRFKLNLITSLKTLVLNLVLPLLAFGLLLLPMLNSPLYAESNQYRLSTSSVLNSFDYPVISNTYRQQAGNTFLSRILFHRHLLLIRELASNYADHLNLNFLFVTGDPNLRHGTNHHGLFLISTLPFLIGGLYQLARKKPQILFILFIWWMAALLPASVPETTPHALRSLNALIPVSIILGWGVSALIQYLLKQKEIFKKVTLSALTLILSVNLFFFLNYYFVDYPHFSAADWQDGYKQMAELITQERAAVRTVWVDAMEQRFYLWILAYGDLSATQIQDLPKDGFQLSAIENIEFTNFDWQKLESLDHKVMIVGETARIQEKMDQAPIQPYKKIMIDDYNHQQHLMAVWYE